MHQPFHHEDVNKLKVKKIQEKQARRLNRDFFKQIELYLKMPNTGFTLKRETLMIDSLT